MSRPSNLGVTAGIRIASPLGVVQSGPLIGYSMHEIKSRITVGVVRSAPLDKYQMHRNLSYYLRSESYTFDRRAGTGAADYLGSDLILALGLRSNDQDSKIPFQACDYAKETL
jgi:hypothetical protein